ncbi:TPA: hypothetical protein ACH3X2_008992 [Trebouxia sp. C0005]
MKLDRIPVQRGRGADKEVKRRRDKHPADQQLYSNIRAPSYHRKNLLDLLRQAVGEQDHARAAVAAVTLLAAQDPKYLPGPEKMFGPVEVKHFPEVAATGFEILRHESSHEELKRYLRKQQDRQLTAEGAELETFELVYLLAEQGEYQDAYDVLDSISSKSTQQFYRTALCGFLRHAQVSEILQKAGCDAAFCRALGRPRPQSGLNMFQYDEQVWTKGGQQLQEFWNSAELHLKEALKLQPSAVREACLLAQLYMMAGQPEDALETARAVREAAPADSDAHGLFILLSEAEGPTSETVTELSQAYLELLVCDPASQHALQGLLKLNARLPIAATSLIEALALHLDVADDSSSSAQQAWTVLAQMLNTAAKLVVDLEATSAQNREQSAAQGDRELPSQRAAADGQPPGEADGQAERQAPGNEGDEQPAGSRAAGAELGAAWDAWQALQELLTVQRHWWKKLHFRWQGSPSAAAGMLEEQQDPEQTDLQRAKAIVAAFMFGTGDDDDTGEDFAPRVQEHMEAAGEFGVAMDIADAAELAKSIKKAHGKRVQETQRSPFDKPLAKFGVVPNMPAVWWTVFPYKRR